MNPDQPSREQIEARLTALLLDELPAEEAELLRWNIEHDPELKKLHDQLKLTIGFVREATKNPTGAPVEKETPLKMSAERRQKLLAHFKTERRPQELPWLKRLEIPSTSSLVIAAIVVLMICGLAAISIPNFVKARATSQANATINNLRQIDAAKNEWALENGKSKGVAVTEDDITPYIQLDSNGNIPTCPAGGTYVIGKVGEPAMAELNGKLLTEPSGTVEFALKAPSPSAGAVQSVTRNPQQPTTPPPLAQIVLPKTEQSQSESSQEESAQVVGYVNVDLGKASLTPVQQEPKAALVVVTGIPRAPVSASSQAEIGNGAILAKANTSLSSMPAQIEGQTASTISGGTSTVSTLPPSSSPFANRLESVEGFISSTGEQAAKSSYGGGAGGGGGGGIGAIPSNAYANNTFGMSGQGSSGGAVSFGGAYNGFAGAVNSMRSAAPHLAPSDNFTITNAVTENQNTFHGSINAARREIKEDEQSDLITREAQNANGVVENNDKLVAVTPIPGSAAPSVELENPPASMAPPSQQPQGQYEYRITNASEGLALLGPLSQQSQEQIVQVERASEAPVSSHQANIPSTPLQNNPADNEMIPPSLIDFQGADVSQVLEVYAQLTGRTLLRSGLPQGQIVLKNETPLTRSAAIQTLQRALALHGIAVINVGDKFVKAVSASEAGTAAAAQTDKPLASPLVNAPIPQPEIQTRDNAFSTFSLNVSDVSFKLAAASLGNGQMPSPDSIRGEEFINAFDYRDPEPLQGQPLAFTSEQARDPFAQEHNLLRFSIKAAAMGRQEGRALNLVLLLDTSGSMERADRVVIIREALRVLSAQLQPQDTVSVVTFARTARLWADGVPGGFAGVTLEKVGSITPEGGTNLEEAMRLAYETARRHFIAGGMNRVVLLTDGAANLGNVDPQMLTRKVESERRKGIALDCFGIGWEDYNDDMLEQLSSNGDGRYAFINSPDEVATEFAAKLAGALQVAAEDVKVQVEFNPDRVTAWRQIGYAKHQLTKEQFRDNSVAAGAIASREAGNAVYVIKTKPDGEGPIATVHVRYRVPGTQDNRERSWLVNYTGAAPALAQASPAMRLAATAAEFSEWLSDSPYAQNVTPDDLLNYLSGIPQVYGTDQRPKQLEWMIQQAKSVSGK